MTHRHISPWFFLVHPPIHPSIHPSILEHIMSNEYVYESETEAEAEAEAEADTSKMQVLAVQLMRGGFGYSAYYSSTKLAVFITV
jgi:hypothetical protein